jgi:hypothetical protein
MGQEVVALLAPLPSTPSDQHRSLPRRAPIPLKVWDLCGTVWI